MKWWYMDERVFFKVDKSMKFFDCNKNADDADYYDQYDYQLTC